MIADNIVQGTPLAAVNDGTQLVLLYQRSEGVFRVYKEPLDGSRPRKQGTDISTITGSPIAPIVVGGGNKTKINVFYIDEDFNLTERTDLLGDGDAKSLSVKANPVAGLAAVVHPLNAGDQAGTPPQPNEECKAPGTKVEPNLPKCISVFYQDFVTNKIHQLTCTDDRGWAKNPEVVPVDPLVVTALAAAVSSKDGGKIHLYYQEKGITLRESVQDGAKWKGGNFRPGNIALQSPIATTVANGNILVYYRELSGTTYVGDDSGPGDGAITTDITEDSEFKHAAVQVGDTLRLYYQDKVGNLKYLFSNLKGREWKNEP